MADKSYKIKTNSKHGGKEFKAYFKFVGRVKPVRKQDEITKSWEDQPYYLPDNKTKTGKIRRLTQFVIETAESNELKCEIAGMEQEFAYPYSSTHKKSFKIAWKDRLDKSKYPDDTYHIINGTDWDRAETVGKQLETGIWVEVTGSYDFGEYNGKPTIKRNVEGFRLINDGDEVSIGREKFKYVTDFKSPEFREVNYFNMQIGIRSTYQEEGGDTKVNATVLFNGKDRSEPKYVELIVYQKEVSEGKRSLADAFASLNRFDFIEVTGQDNNRGEFGWVEVEETLEDDDPFAEVDPSEKVTRMERVTTGTKKGLEITGYVTNSIMRGLLTEEEISKPENPFANQNNDNATENAEDDPFGYDADELPFE
jgi:hypothetical protein